MAALVRTESPAPVRESWMRLGKSLEEEERLEPPEFGVELLALGDSDEWRAAVVDMADPEGVGEATFVALAVRTSSEKPEPEGDDGPRETTDTLYALLERSDDGTFRVRIDDGDEWIDAGEVSEPASTSFVDSVEDYLSTTSSDEAADEH